MSTRALRKLQREREFKLNVNTVDPVSADAVDDAIDDIHLDSYTDSRQSKNRKPVKFVAGTINPFDLLNENNHEEDTVENNELDDGEAKSLTSVSTKAKRKKKKKNKEVQNGNDSTKLTDEDDIDASVRAVNEMLGSLPQSSTVNVVHASNKQEGNMKSLIFIEHRCLNPDNEVRRLFGTRVLQMDQKQKRQRNQHRARSTILSRQGEDWQVHRKTGLSMKLIESTSGGLNFFAFEHSKYYQRIQFEFLDAVESLEPQNVVNLFNEYPFHVDTLLQLSEIFKMSENRQAAAEMIDRALFVFESSFHPLFSLTQGTSRLEYKIAENRSFYLALWRNMITIGRKGCYRTALEYAKLILSLDPDNDPLGIILILDFYALRSEQYNYLIRMHSEWESHRNLSQLPNFAFSVALAMFHQANVDGTDHQQADEKLQTALLKFPGVLMPLVDQCGIAVDPTVQKCDYFNASDEFSETNSLKQLEMLYVGRCESCWRERPVIAWLEANVRAVIERLNSGGIDKNLLEQYANQRQSRYRGAPRNVYRHIVISEIKEATKALPPEIALSPILSYDPLPPTDSVAAYTRPPRRTRAQQDGSNPLAMFFRSLVPNFNPMEPVPQIVDHDDAAPGAVGGANLRQGVVAIMDAMRELLNNIRFMPPPIENPQNEGEDQQDDDIDDDEWED